MNFEKYIVKLSLILLFIGIGIMIISFLLMLSDSSKDNLSKIGDFLSGTSGTIWTLVGVLLLYYAIILQKNQLEEIKKDTEENRKYLTTQLKIQQNEYNLSVFKNHFFVLQNALKDSMLKFRYEEKIGDDAFKLFIKNCASFEHFFSDSYEYKDEYEELRAKFGKSLENIDDVTAQDLLAGWKIFYGVHRSHESITKRFFNFGQMSYFPIHIIDELIHLLLSSDESQRKVYSTIFSSTFTTEQSTFIYNFYLHTKNGQVLNAYTKYFIEHSIISDYPLYIIDGLTDRVSIASYKIFRFVEGQFKNFDLYDFDSTLFVIPASTLIIGHPEDITVDTRIIERSTRPFPKYKRITTQD